MLRTVAARASRRGLALAQQQRGFADKAVATEFNWDAISELIHSEEGKRELQSLRTTYLDISQRLRGLAESNVKIDWAAAQKDLDPALVQGLKGALEKIQWPKYPGNDISEAKAAFAELIKGAEVLAASSAVRAKEIQAELAAIEAEKARLKTLTVDDALSAEPALAKEVDAEAEANSYMAT